MTETNIIIKDTYVVNFLNKYNLNATEIFIKLIPLLELTLTTNDLESKANIFERLLINMDNKIDNISSNFINKLYELRDLQTKEMQILIEQKNINHENIIEKTNQDYIFKLQELLTNILPTLLPNINDKYITELVNKMKDNVLINLDKDVNSIITTNYDNIIRYVSTLLSNCESRLSNNIGELKNECNIKNESIKNISDELSNHLNKFNKSCTRGSMSENCLYKLLIKEFTNAEIKDNRKLTGKCDFELLRLDKSNILIENKDYLTCIKKDDIDKFIRDITNNKTHGIFISQNCGIPYKNNYEINMINNKYIVLYLHNMEYDINKLRTCVNIIDMLNLRLCDSNNSNCIKISADDITIINNEMEELNKTIHNLLSHTKESYKKSLDMLDKLRMDKLQSVLGIYMKGMSNDKSILKCEICKKFTTDKNMSLVAHMRSCKKKYNII
jgi:hypothetical protein